MEDKVHGVEEAKAVLAAHMLGRGVRDVSPDVSEEVELEIAHRRSLEEFGQPRVQPGTHDWEAGPSGTAGVTEPEEVAELLLNVSRSEPAAMVAAAAHHAVPVETVAVAGVVLPPGPSPPPAPPSWDGSGMEAFADEVLAATQPSASTEVPVVTVGAAEPRPDRVPFGTGQPPLRIMPPILPYQLAGETVDSRSTLDMVLRMGLYLRAERRRLDGRAMADQAFAAIGRLLDAYQDNDYRFDGELREPRSQ